MCIEVLSRCQGENPFTGNQDEHDPEDSMAMDVSELEHTGEAAEGQPENPEVKDESVAEGEAAQEAEGEQPAAAAAAGEEEERIEDEEQQQLEEENQEEETQENHGVEEGFEIGEEEDEGYVVHDEGEEGFHGDEEGAEECQEWAVLPSCERFNVNISGPAAESVQLDQLYILLLFFFLVFVALGIRFPLQVFTKLD